MCELRSQELYESKSSQLWTQLLRLRKEEIILHSAVRVFHKLLEIFQKVSRNFSKSCSRNNQEIAFVTKVAQTFLEETKTFFGLMLKFANRQTKLRFLSIFVQFCGVTSVAK